MLLSELPFEEIKPGLKVISALNTPGHVVSTHSKYQKEYIDEDNTINIVWDNGQESLDIWHFWCDKITVNLEEENK